LAASVVAFASFLAGSLLVGLTSFLASALAGALAAGVAGLVGSAANAVTANNVAIKVTIDFILKFPF
jgi:hypothetical protein